MPALLKMIAGRLALAVPLLLVVTFGSYLLLYEAGDPASAVAGETATADQLAAIRESLGLDRPTVIQYFDWLWGSLQGDFGNSYRSGRPVGDLIGQRVQATLSLAALSLVISLLISVPAAVLGARFAGTWIDKATRVGSIIGLSIPNFFFGLLMVLLFAVTLGWLPSAGYRSIDDGFMPWLTYLLLPSITLGLAIAGEQARTLRASLAQELNADYIRTARSKNLSERTIVFRHAFRNSALPLVTVIGLQAGRLIAGAVLIEAVFALPGLGSLLTEAVNTRDFPIVQSVILLTAIVILLMSLLVDLTYGALNPQARKSR